MNENEEHIAKLIDESGARFPSWEEWETLVKELSRFAAVLSFGNGERHTDRNF